MEYACRCWLYIHQIDVTILCDPSKILSREKISCASLSLQMVLDPSGWILDTVRRRTFVHNMSILAYQQECLCVQCWMAASRKSRREAHQMHP